MTGIRKLKAVYGQRGVKIVRINADPEFESLRSDIAAEQMILQTVAEDEHVPET